MVRKPPRLLVALGAAAAACLLVATSADAAMHRRVLSVRMQPRLVPSHVKVGYVGAPGYPYGPPGPIRPTLIDFPPSGFFTPGGIIGTPGQILTAGLADTGTLVPGVIGIGSDIVTAGVGAGTYVVGAGTGYVIPNR